MRDVAITLLQCQTNRHGIGSGTNVCSVCPIGEDSRTKIGIQNRTDFRSHQSEAVIIIHFAPRLLTRSAESFKFADSLLSPNAEVNCCHCEMIEAREVMGMSGVE